MVQWVQYSSNQRILREIKIISNKLVSTDELWGFFYHTLITSSCTICFWNCVNFVWNADEQIRCGTKPTCYKGYCFTYCAAPNSERSPWCYTTKGQAQDGKRALCTADAECDPCWECAEECSWAKNPMKICKQWNFETENMDQNPNLSILTKMS